MKLQHMGATCAPTTGRCNPPAAATAVEWSTSAHIRRVTMHSLIQRAAHTLALLGTLAAIKAAP